MSYDLQAVIARGEVLSACAEDLSAARLGVLGQGLVIMPMTDELFDAVTDGSADVLGFWSLPGGFDGVLARWSVGGPIAYVEAEYFGGVGSQRAAVWADGVLVLGPLQVAEKQPFQAQGSPISQALRRLGVFRGHAVDEFAAAGLPRRRHSSDWISR